MPNVREGFREAFAQSFKDRGADIFGIDCLLKGKLFSINPQLLETFNILSKLIYKITALALLEEQRRSWLLETSFVRGDIK